MNAELKPIGTIWTPYETVEECPNNIQHNGPVCKLNLFDEYRDGLSGLKTGQTILVLYWFNSVDRSVTLQKSSNGTSMIGTFALRSPHRPNPIATAVVPIETIDNGSITVKGLDCLNGTSLLDIKPAILMRELERSEGQVFGL